MYEILIDAFAHCKNVMFRSPFIEIQLKMELEINTLGFQYKRFSEREGRGKKNKNAIEKTKLNQLPK